MASNFIQIAKNEKQQIFKLIVVFFMALFVLFVGWEKISESDVYSSFNVVYNDFAAKIVTNIGGAFGTEIKYQADIKLLSTDTKFTKLIMPVNAYKFFFVGFILLALIPLKHWEKSISAVVFVLLFIAFRAAAISYILLMYRNMQHNVLLVWIDPTIFIAILVLGLYLIQNIKLFSGIYVRIEQRFSEILIVSLSRLFFLLIIIPPLPRVIFTYLHSDIMPGIVGFILSISKLFLNFMGKTVEVSGRIIRLQNNWLDLEYPCIGLGVFTLIAVLIFVIQGNFVNKIIYLSAFAIVFLVLNALRLSVLLLYINKTYHQIGLNKMELHNNATYFMYIVAFVGFLGYWFGVNNYRSVK